MIFQELETKLVVDERGLDKALARAEQLGQNFVGKMGAGFAGLGGHTDRLSAKIQNLVGDFGAAGGAAGRFSSMASTGFSALTVAGGGVAGILGLILTGATAAGVGLFALAKHASEVGSQIHDLSQRTGVSVETLSAFRLAAKQFGTSLEEFAGGLSKFNRLIGEAANGSQQATEKLKHFGIDPQTALTNQEAALGKVFKRINDLPAGIQRSIAAQEAFGKSGDKLVDLIQSAGGNLDEFMKKARAAGLVMSGEAAAAADQFGDDLDALKFKLEAVGLAIGNGVLPEINRAINDIGAALDMNEGSWRDWSNYIADVAQTVRASIAQLSAEMRAFGTLEALKPGRVGEIGQEAGRESIRQSRIARGQLYVLGDEPTDLQKARSRSDLEQAMRGAGLRSHGGGGRGGSRGGGGSQHDQMPALLKQLSDAEASVRLASSARSVDILKGQMDAEQKTLDTSLSRQLISIKGYWQARAEIADASIQAELNQLETTKRVRGDQYKGELSLIDAEQQKGKLTAAEAVAKKQVESAKYSAENLKLDAQINVLLERRGGLITENTAAQAAANKQLKDTFSDIQAKILEAQGDIRGAANIRINSQFEELKRQARANSADFPDASKQVAALERLERLRASMDALTSRSSLVQGRLGLQSDEVQSKIVDGLISEREGRREINALQIQYRDNLRGILGEMLAIANARGDEREVLQIKQAIQENEKLGKVIDENRARARGIVSDSILTGLNDLDKGLAKAAGSFGLHLLQSIRDVANEKVTKELTDALLGKTDQFGSKAGLLGKIFPSLFGVDKSARPDTAIVTNTTATEQNTAAIYALTNAMGMGGGFNLPNSPTSALLGSGRLRSESDFENFFHGSGGAAPPMPADLQGAANSVSDTINASTSTLTGQMQNDTMLTLNSIAQMQNALLVAMTPQQEGFWSGLAKATLSGFVSGATQGLMGGFGGGFGGFGGRTSGGGTSVTSTVTGADDATAGTRPRIVGRRATGGPVHPLAAGEMYQVNDAFKGQIEGFRPNMSGTIIPLNHFATTNNYSPAPPVDVQMRQQTREMVDSIKGLHQMLAGEFRAARTPSARPGNYYRQPSNSKQDMRDVLLRILG